MHAHACESLNDILTAAAAGSVEWIGSASRKETCNSNRSLGAPYTYVVRFLETADGFPMKPIKHFLSGKVMNYCKTGAPYHIYWRQIKKRTVGPGGRGCRQAITRPGWQLVHAKGHLYCIGIMCAFLVATRQQKVLSLGMAIESAAYQYMNPINERDM